MRYTQLVAAGILWSLLIFGGVFNAQRASAVAPANNDLASASVPPTLPYTNIVDTTEATRQSGEPQCDLIAATVWYKYTPSSNVTLSADTLGSAPANTFDTALVIFSGPASLPTFGSLTLVGCNDDALGGNQSQVVFAATAGTTYYFQVGGVAGGTGSLTFNLAVSSVIAPANDNFANAVNTSYTTYAQSTAGAALEPTEQRPCGDQIGATVWYRHVPGANGTLTATTAGSGFDTVLAVYTGASLPTLAMLSCDDDGGPGLTSQLSLSVTSGAIYYLQIGGWDNASGSLTFRLSFVAATDSDGDGVLDSSDNCPSWPNPAQNLPPWSIAATDPDCDGFSSAVESSAGTNPAAHCGVNAWPADINNDAVSDITDIDALAGQFGNQVPPAPARYDVAPDPPDNVIDISDIDRLAGLFGVSC